MSVVKTADIEPGMTLECDVRDRSGRLLLRTDTQINEKYLQTLKAWGVAEVRIKGESEDAPQARNTGAGIDPAVLQAATEEISRHFARANIEHPLVRSLFDICLARMALHKQAEH